MNQSGLTARETGGRESAMQGTAGLCLYPAAHLPALRRGEGDAGRAAGARRDGRARVHVDDALASFAAGGRGGLCVSSNVYLRLFS